MNSSNTNWICVRHDSNTRHYYVKDIRTLYDELGGDRCLYVQNRPVSPETIQLLLHYQEEYYKEHGKYDYDTGKIVIGLVNWNFTESKVLDGQHRLVSAKYLKNGAYCDIVFVNHQTYDAMHKTYLNVNKNTPVPELYKTPDLVYREIFNSVVNNFKYTSVFASSATNPQRPSISKSKMVTKLFDNETLRSKIDTTKPDESVQLILNIMYKYNDLLRDNPYQFPSYGSKSDTHKKQLEKARNWGCFLGMFKDFEWINNMVEYENRNLINFS